MRSTSSNPDADVPVGTRSRRRLPNPQSRPQRVAERQQKIMPENLIATYESESIAGTMDRIGEGFGKIGEYIHFAPFRRKSLTMPTGQRRDKPALGCAGENYTYHCSNGSDKLARRSSRLRVRRSEREDVTAELQASAGVRAAMIIRKMALAPPIDLVMKFF